MTSVYLDIAAQEIAKLHVCAPCVTIYVSCQPNYEAK